MKLFLMLMLTTMLQTITHVCGEDCMSILQIITATRNLCKQQRDNKVLWQQVIDCHRPMTDEFMRSSGEAQCPDPKYVDDPTDTDYSMQDVFLNICGFMEGSWYNQIKSGYCLLFGKSDPFVMSHTSEVAAVQKNWGNDVPCNVGKCILKLGLIAT